MAEAEVAQLEVFDRHTLTGHCFECGEAMCSDHSRKNEPSAAEALRFGPGPPLCVVCWANSQVVKLSAWATGCMDLLAFSTDVRSRRSRLRMFNETVAQLVSIGASLEADRESKGEAHRDVAFTR